MHSTIFSIIIKILILINLESIKSISYSDSDDTNTNNIESINDLNINISSYEINSQKSIFLPEYQNKYSRINELNDTNFNFTKVKSNRSVTLVPGNIIDGNEKQLEIEKITKLINNIENQKITNDNNKNEIYSDDYSFYSDDNQFYKDYENLYYIKRNTLIYERGSSSIKDIITTTKPERLKIENEICKPHQVLFKIKNPNLEENLVIKNIKSDLYQVKILPFISNNNKENTNSIKESEFNNLTPDIDSFFEYSILPKTTFTFQILFLLDHKTTIKGSLYIEFNEKKVLLVPIKLTGKDNGLRINPIYFINHQVRKPFLYPVELFNPTKNTLKIKEILHPFQKIKVFWPNGELIGQNPSSSITNSTLEIEPLSYKKIFYLKFYSTKKENEYGFIHIRTEKNVVVIPVLLNIINSPILTYPTFLNFGLCDVTPKSRNNFLRMIPLKIQNDGLDNIKIGKIYIDYDELFLQFHQNFGGENIVLKPDEEVIFGYVIFNANLEKNLEQSLFKRKNFFGKIIKNVIYMETNSTYTPLIEIGYSYMPYKNNDSFEISGNIQAIPKNSDNYTFITNIKVKKPIKLRKYNSYSPGQDIVIYNDNFLKAEIPNPINDIQAHDSNITITIERISIFRNNHYYFFPLRLNNKLFTIVPIQVDNDDLTKVYCGDEENSRTLAMCMKNLRPEYVINTVRSPVNKKKIFHVNFGNVLQGSIRKKYIYLINENESPININNINIDYANQNFLIDYEGYEYFGNDENHNKIKYPKKGELLEELQNIESNKSISFKIYPYTAVKLSIILLTNENTKENVIKETIVFYYSDQYKFILSLNATIYKGNMNLYPVIYKFEPSFPGLLQNKTIYAKSSFNFPLNILSVSSTDERIEAKKLVDKIYPRNKTTLIEVNFDPSKAYLIKEGLSQFELNMTNVLTYRELYLWKAKEKYFNKMGITGKTEINANVTITTSLDKGDINFKSFLIRPNLSKKEEINFGLTQIGEPVNTFIEGINPSDKMLLIKLVLANDNFGDLNDNSMFNKIDRNLLENNNDLIIFECNFLLMVNATLISKYEYIVVPEKIDPIELRKGTFDKKNLIIILYKYGNQKVKEYLYLAKNALCKYDKKTQNEIIFKKDRKNNYLVSQIFSSEFNQEISSVKNITYKNMEDDIRYKFVEKKSFLNSIISYLFNFYLKYFKNMSIYSNINIIEHSQSFFIDKDIRERVYQVPPHKKFSIGPIIFKPNTSGTIKGVLFLKNNLTILYPIKLKGEGGGGNIKFVDYYVGGAKKKCKLFNEKTLIIEIDENIYEKEIKGKEKLVRSITVMNTGNLPINIKNMTIDNAHLCHTDSMRIIQCKEFVLKSKEVLDIDIEIIPNYRNSFSNKIIYFNTEYQSFYLNVFIVMEKNFYESKNYLYIYIKCFLIVLIIVTIMLYSLAKIINLIQKERREMCGNDEEKEEIKENLLKNENEIKNNENELGYNNVNSNNNNYHQNKNKQKQGKKKKNRKKSNASNHLKDEIEILNNNINEKENINKTKDNNTNNKNDEEKNINNKTSQDEKNNENENKDDNNKNDSYKKIMNNEIKNNEKDERKENKIPLINIPKPKKRKFKGSFTNKNELKENDNKKNNLEKEILSDRVEIKREKNNINNSEEKKYKNEKDKTKSSAEQRINSNENKKLENKNNEIEYEIDLINETNSHNYNYNNNRKNSFPYRNIRKGRRDINKKYYPNNRKYNIYENNINSNSYSNYNNNYQQPQKKQITKIKKENNAKNLKELFEIEHSKKTEAKEMEINNSNLDKKIDKKTELNQEKENISKNNNLNNNLNNIIINDNNISNIKLENDEGIEEDFTEELFGNKKQNIFDYNIPISKKISKISRESSEKNEEMNPTFLNDIKTNNAFDAEQELMKSLKKDNKELSNKSNNGEFSKEDSDMDFNSSHFNFNYDFFQTQQENEEPELEDNKIRTLIDNLNNVENPFTNEEQKEKLDSFLNNYNVSNKEESEDKKDVNEYEDSFKVNEYEQFLANKKKFGNFNIFDYEINYDNQNNEDKKFQNKFDEYQKTFGRFWKK